MKFGSWLWRIAREVAPDAGEIFKHVTLVVLLIAAELLLYGAFHLPGFPEPLVRVAEPILAATLRITLIMFAAGSIAVYGINACKGLRKHLPGSRAIIVWSLALTCITGIAVREDSFPIRTEETGPDHHPPAVDAVFSLYSTRAPTPPLKLGAQVHIVDLLFFVPFCEGCQYYAGLDRRSLAPVYSGDNYGNFVYRCRRADLAAGEHVLRIIEVNQRNRQTERSYEIAFEVQP